jgi:RNA polymerase sigma factor (sigma-70 family)
LLDCLRRAAQAEGQADLPDGRLLEDYLKHRDKTAIAALVGRHGPMVWGVCRRVLGNPHDAEDAFQATFLVLVRRAAAIVPRGMVGNWLYGVAHQTALKARATAAKRQRRERQVKEMPEPAARPEPEPGPDLGPLLDQELARLPDKYRVAVVLCDLEGRTYKEAARRLQIPEGTLSTRLRAARALLTRRLARHGLAVSGGVLATALARQVASAGVPAAVASSTIQAATLVAAGRGAAVVVSARVAALTEGVLKSMYVMKLKTVITALLVAGILAIPTTRLAYRALAGEEANQAQRQDVPSDRPARVGADTDQRLQEEVKRLRAENEELKKRLQQATRKGKAGDGKLVTKVYPVLALIGNPNREQTETPPLIRVITKTIEPASWNAMGGDGSIEYLPGAASLIIRQSPDIQKQVQELLEALRRNREEQARAEPKGA